MTNEPKHTSERMSVSADTATAIFSPDALDKLLRFAEVMANGRVTVPAHLAGKPADCLAVTMQATQWHMNPFAVAQKTFTVGGVLGYEAQLVNAVINTRANIRDRIHYQWYGPWENVIGKFVEKTSPKGNKYTAPGWSLSDEAGCGVRVWATMSGENEARVLELLLSQAQVRNSTLWASDPKQQLAYLAVKRWARLYCPEVILGVYTPDELEPVVRAERVITPENETDLNALIQLTSENKSVIANGNLPKNKEEVKEEISDAVTVTVAGNAGEGLSAQNPRKTNKFRSPDEILADFTAAAMITGTVSELVKCFDFAEKKLAPTPDLLEKATDVYLIRRAEIEESQAK